MLCSVRASCLHRPFWAPSHADHALCSVLERLRDQGSNMCRMHAHNVRMDNACCVTAFELRSLNMRCDGVALVR